MLGFTLPSTLCQLGFMFILYSAAIIIIIIIINIINSIQPLG